MNVQAKTDLNEILRVENVTVNFDGFKALDCLNFRLERGEIHVVIGPNGAGKTTLLDVITGQVQPTSGKVVFQPDARPARNVVGMSPLSIARLGIGRKFQTPNVFKSLSVLENLKLSLRYPRSLWSSLVASVWQDGIDRIAEILRLIGLSAKAYSPAGILAHGEKQWLELGMLMAQEPELMLVDEPVAGMTPKETERTGELLLAMARKHTLLIIEHDMTFVRQIARTVTVFDEGRLLCQGTVQEVQRDPKVIQVYLGEDWKAADAAGSIEEAAVALEVAPKSSSSSLDGSRISRSEGGSPRVLLKSAR
jgi:urea transport system ATP-binding protein